VGVTSRVVSHPYVHCACRWADRRPAEPARLIGRGRTRNLIQFARKPAHIGELEAARIEAAQAETLSAEREPPPPPGLNDHRDG
jgi:hypothetical protein